MAKDIDALWTKLSLMEAEHIDVCIEKDWVEDTIKECRNYLEFDGLSKPYSISMDWCPFWIQIHELPIGFMNEKVGIVLGDSLGDVEEVETSEGKLAWGKFMRLGRKMVVDEVFGSHLNEERQKRGPIISNQEGIMGGKFGGRNCIEQGLRANLVDKEVVTNLVQGKGRGGNQGERIKDVNEFQTDLTGLTSVDKNINFSNLETEVERKMVRGQTNKTSGLQIVEFSGNKKHGLDGSKAQIEARLKRIRDRPSKNKNILRVQKHINKRNMGEAIVKVLGESVNVLCNESRIKDESGMEQHYQAEIMVENDVYQSRRAL
ncbi:hypothetical protein REPUB_Repub07fG0108000 [Reevesia pubescens]